MLRRGELQWPKHHVGRTVRFADGTSARVFRETAVPGASPRDPCLLLVSFRLRGVRGGGHRLFRLESILNTPLFVGFPGFVSKLWLAHDDQGVYRGIYEWDGAGARRELRQVVVAGAALVCVEGSIDYQVLPACGATRCSPAAVADRFDLPPDQPTWWRVVAA